MVREGICSKMATIRQFAKYLLSSPKLYRIYVQSPEQQQESPSSRNSSAAAPIEQYSPGVLESLTDATITYILPITLLLSVYNRKLSYLQLTILIYITSRLLRSLSRLSNPQYARFLSTLEDSSSSASSLHSLRTTYDFEFSYFPLTHACNVSVHDWEVRQRRDTGLFSYYTSWLIAHSFGIRLIYPGLILGGVLRAVLEDGRSKLVTEKGGTRVKVRVGSDEGGEVCLDAMVFDNRGQTGSAGAGVNGSILVICCEGNAGFYEIGMLGGALSEGYSVLGWNHPGFGGSTGTPYPATELTAALGVMDYALNVLGFEESNIIVYGWSIGGFPAGYLASRYKGIRGLLLDATFDNILPLAIPRMPEFMTPLVISTIRNHVNLDNTANLAQSPIYYTGPIRIIRRTDDEIIADPPGQLKCNRGNQLLMDIVVGRYLRGSGAREVSAEGMKYLEDWVNRPHDRESVEWDCLSGLDYDWGDKGEGEGRMLVGIASSILRDYKSTHCTPLPREFYRIRN